MEGIDGKVEGKVDVDSILINEIGQFGRFQLRTLALAAVGVIFAAFHAEYVFTTARINTRFGTTYKYKTKQTANLSMTTNKNMFWNDVLTVKSQNGCRCLIPECENAAEAVFAPAWIANAVPSDGDSFDDCQRFANTSSAGASNDTCPATMYDSSVVLPCDEYVYENTQTVVYDVSTSCKQLRNNDLLGRALRDSACIIPNQPVLTVSIL